MTELYQDKKPRKL